MKHCPICHQVIPLSRLTCGSEICRHALNLSIMGKLMAGVREGRLDPETTAPTLKKLGTDMGGRMN